MEAIYRINTNELGIGFVNSVKMAYPDQIVEIKIREQADCKSDDFKSEDSESDESGFDETEYLMRSPNGEHLLKAMKNIEEGRLVTFETMEQLEECISERDTEKGAALLQAARERGAALMASGKLAAAY